MSQPPPPPPPRHGDNPRTTAGGSGLPPGKYDVFIIPEHSAGSGFLYLPSLKPQWNSFIAGVVSTMAVVIMSNLASPMIISMVNSPDRLWSFLWVTLVACVGLAAFLLGRHQNEPAGQQQNKPSGSDGGHQKPGGGHGSSWYTPPPQNAPPPNQAPPPPPPPPPQHENPRDGGGQYQSWHEQPRQQPQSEPQAQPPPPPQPEARPSPQAEPQPEPKPQTQEPRREEPREEPKPKPTPAPEPKHQPQSPPPPRPSSSKSEAPKGAWEKAREEMRRREEERKVKEADAKKKEDTARRLRELREREARERERRERESKERDLKEKLRKEQEVRERERLEREVREKVEKEVREKAEKEAREREARERAARDRQQEARLQEEARKREDERVKAEKERAAARERERKEREERLAKLRKEQEEREKEKEREEKEREREKTERKGTSYAYSSVGEKTSMWPNGKPPSVAPSQAASTPPPEPRPTPSQAPPPQQPPRQQPPSPTKPATPRAPSPTKPTASTTGTEDTYSYRPYDKPKKPTARKKSVSDFSESSWAPSASTARTTPPPSTRGPYTTADPQKIVIKAVYGYLNQFSKTPASQLITGVGPVTDGLILRITSAGLFVDDDVRGIAQREWDVKAWTLKLVEVWCPVHAATAQAGNTPGTVPTSHPFFKTMPQAARRAAERGATKTMLGEEAVEYIDEFGRVCDGNCRRGGGVGATAGGEKGAGLHIVRATIRDQEGKRYVFVIGEEEGWKIAAGLAALRGSSQVRALGVAGFSGMESKTLLDTLGWGG